LKLSDTVFDLLSLTAKSIIGVAALTAKLVILIGGGLLAVVMGINDMVFSSTDKE
jgi:hypothetical protein